MELPLFDTHAHLISDDWDRYPPLAVKPGLPTRRTDYTVTAEALVDLMDKHDVPVALAVQRLHVYGYDNSYGYGYGSGYGYYSNGYRSGHRSYRNHNRYDVGRRYDRYDHNRHDSGRGRHRHSRSCSHR